MEWHAAECAVVEGAGGLCRAAEARDDECTVCVGALRFGLQMFGSVSERAVAFLRGLGDTIILSCTFHASFGIYLIYGDV